MKRSIHREYITRIARYAWANKGLLFLTIIAGTLGFAVTFVFPWLIGSLIDDVIQPRNPVPYEVRMHRLWVLTSIGIVTALLFAIAGYGRGHFNMKLGNRIVMMLRRDVFDHLQKLSLQFYSHQRTGGLVWRVMHEVHGVNGLIHGGVILLF